MKVLSLFDGMSCGQIALRECGIIPEMYFAAEIKPHAIQCTQANFPQTIQLGDVRNVVVGGGKISSLNGTFDVGTIDLLIGGSPCQDFSRLNKTRAGLAGDKSSLFYEFLRIKNEANPHWFLLENVVMDAKDVALISELLGVRPVKINSALVSAQYRERLYWTNIGTLTHDLFGEPQVRIEPIKDRNIVAKDIIESGTTDRNKFLCLTARCGGRWGDVWQNDKYKSPHYQKQFARRYAKAFDNCVFDNGFMRLLTTKEMRRLQTIPDWYNMDSLGWVDAANLLGDGWTVEVIKHLFEPLQKTI